MMVTSNFYENRQQHDVAFNTSHNLHHAAGYFLFINGGINCVYFHSSGSPSVLVVSQIKGPLLHNRPLICDALGLTEE